MKRTIIAFILLALIIGSGVASCLVLKGAASDLGTALQEVEEAYRQGKEEECRRKTEELQRQYEQRAVFFPFVLNHETVHGLEESVTQLRTLLETGDDTMFLSEVIHCRALVEEMYRKELPLWENIF